MAAHNASSLNICTSATLKEKVYATRYQRYHTSHPQTLHPILSLFGITKKLIAQSVINYKTILMLRLILKHIV